MNRSLHFFLFLRLDFLRCCNINRNIIDNDFCYYILVFDLSQDVKLGKVIRFEIDIEIKLEHTALLNFKNYLSSL